jgi:methionine sulfoxide reductase heme-binding subunit
MTESILWYTTRAAGYVSLIMLTGVVALGVMTSVRWQRPGWPRFLSAELHRNLALISMVFLAVHVLIAVLDPYTALGLSAALLPFSSAYRQFWLGLGGVALYLLIAVVISSLARAWLGARAWRLVHWLTYAAWPVALLHGLGTGSDTSTLWGVLIDAACLAVVAAAVVWRVGTGRTQSRDRDLALAPLPRRFR